MLLLLSFVIRHKLSKEATNDLLYIVNLVCPKPKLFSSLQFPTTFHYYCPTCIVSINYPAIKVCEICNMAFSSAKLPNYFVHLSISDRIKQLFTKETFTSNILYRFKRTKSNPDNYEDIYDGLLYRKLMAPGALLSNPSNLSLTWNVDGVPIFKLSKFSLWPLYFVINELPFKLRHVMENVILAGLWFGELKPNMSIFLKPVFNELMKLEQHGIEVKSQLYIYPFISKVVVLAGTCDLPAKCLVLNSIQFNGKFGCLKCLQPGVTFHIAARRHTHVYPFCCNDPNGPKHSKRQHHLDARNAMSNGSITNGIKGPSWLMLLQNYNVVDSTAIDYMHCVLLGITKLLLSL